MTIPDAWMPAAHMERVIIHWTAGAYAVSHLDREHYHLIWAGDGTLARGDQPIDANASPKKAACAAHTLGCNTGSIGVSMAAMAGAVEQPFDAGRFPLTPAQWSAMIAGVAQLCRRYGIPVTERTVLTHAEVQPTLGIKQRGKWDITRIPFDPSVRGAKACGDKIRREVQAALEGLAPVAPAAAAGGVVERGRGAIVRATSLNLRAQPSASAEILAQLAQDTRLAVMGEHGDWLAVRTLGGRDGFVAARFVERS